MWWKYIKIYLEKRNLIRSKKQICEKEKKNANNISELIPVVRKGILRCLSENQVKNIFLEKDVKIS